MIYELTDKQYLRLRSIAIDRKMSVSGLISSYNCKFIAAHRDWGAIGYESKKYLTMLLIQI